MDKVFSRSNVNHPPHYGGKIECIDYIESALNNVNGATAFCLGNAIKYIHRYPFDKNRDDLKKAIWYLSHVVNALERDEEE